MNSPTINWWDVTPPELIRCIVFFCSLQSTGRLRSTCRRLVESIPAADLAILEYYRLQLHHPVELMFPYAMPVDNPPCEDVALALVQLLLIKGANPNANNAKALRAASKLNYNKVVRVLVPASRASLWALREALYQASEKGHIDVVATLLSFHADPRGSSSKAFVTAAKEGHGRIVELLLDAGADVHARSDEAIVAASWNGHDEVVKVLLRRGADVESGDGAPLRLAVAGGHATVVGLLLESGANMNSDLFHSATLGGFTEVLNVLMRYGYYGGM
ncbi:hypothetical protein HK104_008314 [Borealophlyctis nickersoniae]|nr:hypothetical protein HK104_008314 [Borealophlyctis nickersoniae]